MPETLTIDNTPESEVLSAEEQDSLEVGEKLVAEQEGLLAGKYKNAEELESAYIELQKKLGDKDGVQEDTEATKEEVKEEEPETEKTPAVALLTEATDEYYANDNKLSKETIEKFGSLSSQDLVAAYIEMQKNAPKPSEQTERDVSDAQINKIQNSVGGEAQYSKLMQWASDNLPKNQVDAFDNLVGTGNADSIQLGVTALKSEYDKANGFEGRMLSGKKADAKGDVFRSQAELVQAMNDPRYESDSAYRSDIINKLDRSDVNF